MFHLSDRTDQSECVDSSHSASEKMKFDFEFNERWGMCVAIIIIAISNSNNVLWEMGRVSCVCIQIFRLKNRQWMINLKFNTYHSDNDELCSSQSMMWDFKNLFLPLSNAIMICLERAQAHKTNVKNVQIKFYASPPETFFTLTLCCSFFFFCCFQPCAQELRSTLAQLII